MLETFLSALHDQKKVRLQFFSKEDGTTLTRLCAPMDYGPSRKARDKSDRYHFWDYDSDTRRHVLSLLPHQVIAIAPLEDDFDPGEFVTWDTTTSKWFVARDWGNYS